MNKIAIVGPESTGKSELSAQLAAFYKTVYVPEIARSYLDQKNGPYTLDDIVRISELQMKEEDTQVQHAKEFLFCDTNLLVTKVWAEHAFKELPEFISKNILKRKYTLHLLTNIDLPWEADPLREHPHLRDYFFNVYRNLLIDMNVPFEIISGKGEERLQHAIHAIEKHFQANTSS